MHCCPRGDIKQCSVLNLQPTGAEGERKQFFLFFFISLAASHVLGEVSNIGAYTKGAGVALFHLAVGFSRLLCPCVQRASFTDSAFDGCVHHRLTQLKYFK